jgi:AraC-like DNA-binding protein
LPNAIAFFVHAGRAKWQIGDAIVIAKPDDLLFIPEGVWHSAEHLPERRFCVSAIHFTARLFGSLDVLSVLGFPVHVPKLPEAGSAVNELLRLSARQPLGWQRRGAALVTDLLLRVAQERPELLRPTTSPLAVTALKVLHPAIQFAEDHLRDRVTVTGMAKAASCSVRHLRRLFREAFGVSPKQWLIERRLQKVAHLLAQTDLPLKVVAAECGFDDLPHFHRLFRRRFGQSPAQFRRSAFRGL